MDYREYQTAAGRTANRQLSQREALANWSIGVGGETGKLQRMIGEIGSPSAPAAMEGLPSKIGDIGWYSAMLCLDAGVDFEPLVRQGLEAAAAERRSLSELIIDLGGASGEILEIIKHHLFHRTELWPALLAQNVEKLVAALAGLCAALGFSFDSALERNLQDLAERYPHGFRPLTGSLIAPGA